MTANAVNDSSKELFIQKQESANIQTMTQQPQQHQHVALAPAAKVQLQSDSHSSQQITGSSRKVEKAVETSSDTKAKPLAKKPNAAAATSIASATKLFPAIQPKPAFIPLAPKQAPLKLSKPTSITSTSHKTSSSGFTVNTSKQWVLPPRPRPGRKSLEKDHHDPKQVNHVSTLNKQDQPRQTKAKAARSKTSSPSPMVVTPHAPASAAPSPVLSHTTAKVKEQTKVPSSTEATSKASLIDVKDEIETLPPIPNNNDRAPISQLSTRIDSPVQIQKKNKKAVTTTTTMTTTTTTMPMKSTTEKPISDDTGNTPIEQSHLNNTVELTKQKPSKCSESKRKQSTVGNKSRASSSALSTEVTPESFELRAQLQNATEENENLRKIIDKLNREIDLLRLAKLEKKQKCGSQSLAQSLATNESILSRFDAPSNNDHQNKNHNSSQTNVNIVNRNHGNHGDEVANRRRLTELASTIDPIKINYNLKSKRLKRYNSDVGSTSASAVATPTSSLQFGMNGNTLDDAGFYNADTLMSSTLDDDEFFKSLQQQINENDNMDLEALIDKSRQHVAMNNDNQLRSLIMEKTRTMPATVSNSTNNNDICGFCSGVGGSCVCYYENAALDLFQTQNETYLPNLQRQPQHQQSKGKKEENGKEDAPISANQATEGMRLSRTTEIIGDLGRNFIKNEMDVDMSFFVKQED